MSSQDSVLVTILRRDESDLISGERELIIAAFTGKKVIFRRTDPIDFQQHAEQCRQLKPAAVILPRERPIPALAMEEGFQHITVFAGRGVVELEPLVPQFKEFVPK